LIAINVWRGSPFTMVILLAGLQTVPHDQLEAARIDGANNVQQFIHVTLPHLRKILLIVMLVFALFNFNNFDLIYLTTQGGPLDRTMTLPVKTYEVAFKGMEVGASSALAMMMLCLLVILSFVYFHFLRITSDSR
jgi:multiple sugar transport system permease protein